MRDAKDDVDTNHREYMVCPRCGLNNRKRLAAAYVLCSKVDACEQLAWAGVR